ncbi:MAG: hypothetical protein ACTSSG_00400 [Candidatus Heimdallarchaeaceae archaeon]
MKKPTKVNLQDSLIEGDSKCLERFCREYFEKCDFSSEYKIEAVCSEGLMKLFCGYFKNQYGIIEIEIVGLYPAEIEEIESSLIAVMQEKMRDLPKRRGFGYFNYEISQGRVMLRLYAPEKGCCPEREDILKSIEDLSPALEFLNDFLRMRKISQ